LNSFHSVAITIASAFLVASRAEAEIVTCFLTRIRLVSHDLIVSQGKRTVLKRDERVGLLKIHPDLVMLDLRIVDVDEGTLRQEVLDQSNCSGLAGITCVRLESKAEDSDPLAKHDLIYGDQDRTNQKRTLPVMVLNRVSTTRLENLLFWYSFISTTCRQ
jgi:hypothetical protein